MRPVVSKTKKPACDLRVGDVERERPLWLLAQRGHELLHRVRAHLAAVLANAPRDGAGEQRPEELLGGEEEEAHGEAWRVWSRGGWWLLLLIPPPPMRPYASAYT